MIAHDLAADQSWEVGHVGFRVGRSRVAWESAAYPERTGSYMRRVRIARLVERGDGALLTRVRYVDPETAVVLIPRP